MPPNKSRNPTHDFLFYFSQEMWSYHALAKSINEDCWKSNKQTRRYGQSWNTEVVASKEPDAKIRAGMQKRDRKVASEELVIEVMKFCG